MALRREVAPFFFSLPHPLHQCRRAKSFPVIFGINATTREMVEASVKPKSQCKEAASLSMGSLTFESTDWRNRGTPPPHFENCYSHSLFPLRTNRSPPQHILQEYTTYHNLQPMQLFQQIFGRLLDEESCALKASSGGGNGNPYSYIFRVFSIIQF